MFDDQKATQLVNYFAKKEGGRINYLKTMKLVYLADKYHLRKYGKLISNDQYFAMGKGPVASNIKNICSYVVNKDIDSDNRKHYCDKYIEKGRGYFILQSKKNPDLEYFSEVEVESMDAIYENFKDFNEIQLFKVTHDTFEWKSKEDVLKKGSLREQMDLEDFFVDEKYPKESPLSIFNTSKVNLEKALNTYKFLKNTSLSYR